MQDTGPSYRQLLVAVASLGVVAGAAVLLGVPWRGVLVALVTMILGAATVQGLRRRRDDDEPRGRILHMRNRRGGR